MFKDDQAEEGTFSTTALAIEWMSGVFGSCILFIHESEVHVDAEETYLDRRICAALFVKNKIIVFMLV